MSAGRPRHGFVGLLVADGVSALGTRMSALAVPWFVLATTGSGTAAGLAVAAELVPYVVAQAVGGPAVDRLGAWRTRVGGDLIAAFAVATVPVLWAVGALPFAALCGVLVAVGIVRGFSDTAGMVLLPGVAEQSGTVMERAAGLHDGVKRVASLVGAPVAGVLIAVTSAPAVLVVDAVSFALAALVVLARVPRSAQVQAIEVQAQIEGQEQGRDDAPTGSPEPGGYLASLTEGFRFLRGDRLLLGIAVMVAMTNLLDQAWSAVLAPSWATDVARSPIALGLVFAAVSAGAVTGNVVVSWLGPRLPRRATFAIGFVIAGAPRFVALAVATTVSPVFVVTLLAGLGAGVLNPILGAVEFERVPRQLQARVLGATNAVAWVGMPVGGLAAGLGVDHLGLVPTVWIAAGLYLATTAAPFVFPSWRGMDRAAPAPSALLDSPVPNSAGVGSTPVG